MPKKSSPSKNDESGFPIKRIIISSFTGCALFFILLLSLAALLLNSSADQSSYLLYGIVAGGISGFAGGFLALRLVKEKGIFFGALCGFVQSLLCSVVIFIINKGTAGNGIFILMAVTTLMSSLGGITSVNIKKKIKY